MTGGERVRAYYEDLNKGNAEAVSAHFTEDVSTTSTTQGYLVGLSHEDRDCTIL
jgi:hypothetical protein